MLNWSLHSRDKIGSQFFQIHLSRLVKQLNNDKFYVFFFIKKIGWPMLYVFLCFHFASFDSLKAVTGCFEKFDTSAKRFGLKNDLN